MKYLLKFIFPFLRSAIEVKCGVKFYHSTRNAVYGIQREAQKNNIVLLKDDSTTGADTSTQFYKEDIGLGGQFFIFVVYHLK